MCYHLLPFLWNFEIVFTLLLKEKQQSSFFSYYHPPHPPLQTPKSKKNTVKNECAFVRCWGFLLALLPPVSHFPFISGPLRVQIRFLDCTGTARESNPGGPVALLIARGTLGCAGSSCCARDVWLGYRMGSKILKGSVHTFTKYSQHPDLKRNN